jgi:hypothetical protein
LTYDAAGNQTGSSAGQQLGYNTLNQTSSARKSTGTVNRTLSYLGATQYTRTAYGATNVVNSSALGVVAHGAVAFTRTPDGTLVSRRSGTARAYYLRDGLGSTAALVDAAGTVRNRYAYSPWGQTTTTCPTNACVSNPFAYTGAEHDEGHGAVQDRAPLLPARPRPLDPTRPPRRTHQHRHAHRSPPLPLRRLQPHQLHRPKRALHCR